VICLDEAIREAWQRRGEWSDTLLRAALECICRGMPRTIVQWDLEAGESWARLLSNGRVLALLRVDCPLALVGKRDHDLISKCLSDAVVVSVESMQEPVFSGDREVVQLLCVGQLAKEFNEKQFSIDELWWATV
jgi:hypothetical protein